MQGLHPEQKARESTKTEKARKKLILNLDSSASEAPEEEGESHAGNLMTDDSWTPAAGWISTKAHTAWMAVPFLNHSTRGS